MKKACPVSALILLVGCFLFSCSASRNQTASAIGLVPLSDYAIVNNNTVDDTTYRVTQSEANFISAVKTISANAKKPSFDGQVVIALFTKPSSALQFEKSEFTGNRVHVYLRSCIPSSQPDCSSNRLFMATIPKVGNARRVQFFVNNEAKAIVDL
jgi:hypothetical protein